MALHNTKSYLEKVFCLPTIFDGLASKELLMTNERIDVIHPVKHEIEAACCPYSSQKDISFSLGYRSLDL